MPVVSILRFILLPPIWLTAASCVFLWMAGLWDNPLIPSWSRPWQWLIYLRHGDGSFSEGLYLIGSAIIASYLAVLWVRATAGSKIPLYGRSVFADPTALQQQNVQLKRRLF